MKLVWIIGDAAVGKMTVGQELMKQTGLRLFHNHMMIEPVLEIFGSSMTPTLSEGQYVVAVKDNTPQTGDIVAFYYGNKVLVKRCIAGPGNWVDILADGTVTVNGEVCKAAQKGELYYVEITDICNRNCSFCPGTKRAPRRMTEAEFRTIADKLKSVTKYLYFHVMGEPLTHPLLTDFIRMIQQ